MYCASDLRKMTVLQLEPIARDCGITRTHSLRKAELVSRILKSLEEKNLLAPEKSELPELPSQQKDQDPPSPVPLSDQDAQLMRAFTERASSSLKKTESSIAKVAAAQNQSMPQLYSTRSRPNELAYLPDAQSDIAEDSFILDMIDPYWLHVTWCLRRKTLERAKAGLGQYWFTARPMLRITVLNDGDGSGGRFHHLRDMFIHGHVNHWFIPVSNPPATYVVELGFFCTVQKKFFTLVRSNVVSTPQVRSALRYEKSAEVAWMSVCGIQPSKTPSWSPNNHNLYKKWSERTARTLASDSSTLKVDAPEVTQEEFPLRVTTEMIVYGSTTPDNQVTINSEWVAVQPDGTFMLRIDVPEQGRQMLVIDSQNSSKSQQMTLTVERTTQMHTDQKPDKR